MQELIWQEAVDLVGDCTGDRLDGKARASIIGSTTIVTMSAANGSANMSMHINHDSLRAFAKLLNDAVAALPAKIEEAA